MEKPLNDGEPTQDESIRFDCGLADPSASIVITTKRTIKITDAVEFILISIERVLSIRSMIYWERDVPRTSDYKHLDLQPRGRKIALELWLAQGFSDPLAPFQGNHGTPNHYSMIRMEIPQPGRLISQA